MPRELVNAKVTHVSYVDKGANRKQFFMLKSEEKPTFQREVSIFINKNEEEKRLVYGVVYEPDVVDSQGEYMTAEEIEKAAHGFLKDARNIDHQHDFNSGVGEVVESYIAPIDFEIGDELIKKGAWVLVTKASPEIWEAIKKGEITGYSMAGTAEVIEKQDGEEEKKPDELSASMSEKADDEIKGFFNLLKNFFTKGEVRTQYEQNQKNRNLWAAWDGLENAFYSSVYDNVTPEIADFERLQEAVDDFSEIIQEIRNSGDIEKALKNKPSSIGKGGEEMKKEEIEKLLDEKLSPITERLENIEKEEGIKKEDEGDEILKQFGELLDQKLTPIEQRLEVVEKARGVSKQVDPDEVKEPVQKSSDVPSYMRYFA